MKNKYFLTLLCLVALQIFGLCQTNTTATFSSGNISTDFFSGTVTTTMNSNCPGILTVPVPTGRYVTSVAVEYSFEALGINWQSEQSSYLECVTTSTKEAAVSFGPAINTAGTVLYNRTGLTIANGVVPAGGVQFRLHAWRSFTTGGCSNTAQRILNNTFKITVTHVPAPSCLPPTGVTVNSVTANSATVGWTTGGASNWQIEYGPAGFTPGTGTIVPASTNPFSLTGLSPSTRYEFRVRDSCGLGDVSFWSSLVSFRTNCSVISAPWSEDFESVDWQPGTGFGVLGTIDTCFSRNFQNHFTMKAGPPQFVSTFSGPAGDHTTGSGKYIYSERRFFGTFPTTARIQTPPIDLSTLTIPELTFWYHMFGTDVNKLEVLISTNGGLNFTSIFSKTGQQQFAQSDPWIEAVVNLSAYANSTVVLKFEVLQSSTGLNGDVSVDDVSIHEQPTCPKPSNLSAIASTATTVTLGWTSGGASNWQIEYGPIGFTPGTGTVLNASSNPFTVSGLSLNTNYRFYVRDSCSATDKSFWSTPTNGKTTCSPVLAPYFENFDGAVWNRGTSTAALGTINSCWQRDEQFYIFKSGPPQFVSTFTGTPVDHTTGTASGKYLQGERIFFTSTVDTATITSVPVDLTALTVPEMTFWYHMFGADIDRLQVYVSDDDGASFSQELQIVGQQQNSNSDAWKEGVVNLSAYANDTILVKFVGIHINFATNADIDIDDFDIHEQPTCPKPSNLVATASTANSVTLSWTSGGASNWQIEYGAPGFTLGTGTIVNASTNPFTVTGLNSSSTYDFYVRDSCSATDVSFWSQRVTYTTDCLPLLAPFTENFDGPQWVVGPNFNDTGSVALCWKRTPLQDYFWKPGPPVFTSTLTGPAGDHTTGNGKFLFAESIFGGGTLPFNGYIETPSIDLSALNVPELSFWYHMFGSNVDLLAVEINNGSGYAQLWSKTGQQQTSGTAPWKEAVISLSAYANDTVKLRFKASKNVFNTLADVAIDDVDIHEAPSCPKPQDLLVVGQTSSTVTLQWTTGGASNWNVEYGSPGFTPGSGTLVNTAVNPFTVTGLSGNTAYEFYVRDSCGAGDVSAWIGPVRDTTDCNPIPAPYLETFDGTTFVVGTSIIDPGDIDACWYRDLSLNFVWAPQSNNTSFGTGPTADHTSGTGKFLNSQRAFGNVIQSQEAILISPLVDLAPLTTPEMSFWYHMFGADIDSLSVQIYEGGIWKHVHSIAGQQQPSKTAAWKEAIVNISSYANDTIKVRFKAYRSSNFAINSAISIDDLDIHEQPSCPKPSALTILSTSANSMTLSWTTGGASNWQIEYGLSGFTPGTGNIVNASTNPFTVTGLSSSTTYDFYVRDSCSATDVSAWQGKATGATDCLPVLAPWSENFDGVAWDSGINFNDTGTVAQCWKRTPLSNFFWRTGPGPFPSTFTGPAADHTTGSGKFIFTELNFSGGTAPMNGFIETPLVDLTALTNPELRFWYHMFGTSIGTLTVEIDDGNGYTQVWTKSGQQQTSGTDPWEEVIIGLSSYVNDTIQVRIKGTLNVLSSASESAVDDISIDEAPTCPRPQNITTTTSTTTSITLSWTSGGASNWIIGYRLAGTSGALTFVPANTNPFTINGLSPSTSYDFYVKDSCAAGDASIWEGPLGATTQCGVATAPWAENFDNTTWISGTGTANTGNVINTCWIRPNSNNPNFGTRSGPTSSVQTGPDTDVSGTGKYIYTEASGASGTGEISTPLIYIPNTLQNPRLKFAYHMFGNNITSLGIKINSGTGFGANVMTKSGAQHTANNDPWKVDSVSLNAYKGDTIRIKFLGANTGFNGDISIDEVQIISDPSSGTCSDPSNLNFTATTPTGFTITWSGNGNSQVEVVPMGQPQGSGTTYFNVTSPLIITGLVSKTTYDVYVRDSCGTTLFSQWVDDTVSTLICPPITPLFTSSATWLAASFNSLGTLNSDSVYWTFGDGSNSSIASPGHNYSAAGSYIVTLHAFSDCGSIASLVDTLEVCDTLMADFSFLQTGDTVNFDASSSSNATSYHWDFAGVHDTTGLTVNYKFPSPGTKAVTLTAYNNCGDSLKVTKNVKVCLPPVASWTYNIISTTGSGMKVQFDGSASQNAITYEWDFGDGSVPVVGQVMPQHTYITPGLFYFVKLKVTNTCGDGSSANYRLNQIGLNELEAAQSVDVFPNPADDRLTIKWDQTQLNFTQLEILDNAGKRVLAKHANDSAHEQLDLDVSELAAGHYLLRFTSDQGVFVQKITIQ